MSSSDGIAARPDASARLVAPLPYARLSTFYFCYFAGIGAFVPYWSLYLDARGLEPVAIGALMSLWYGTRMFAPSLWGWAAARDPRPVRWLRAGAVLTLVSLVPLAFPLPLQAMAWTMGLFCAAFNAILPQFESLTLSHLVGRTDRYGGIRVWGSLGFIVVVAAFGAIFERVSPLRLPLLMLPLLALLAWAAFRNDYGSPAAHQEESSGLSALLFRREVLVFLLLAFLMQVAFGPYNTFFSLYLKENGYRPAMLGAFWSIGVGVEIVVFAFAAPLLRRIPARRMIVLALMLAALRWVVTGLAPRNMLLMVLAQLSHAIIFGGFFAACMQLMAEFFPGRASGHGQALLAGFAWGFGGVVGALISGYAWEHGGGGMAFLIAGAAAAVAAVVALRVFRAPVPG